MFLAALVYSYFAYQQWQVTKDSADAANKAAVAAKEAADTAARQLEMSERPWVSSAATISSPFWMDENGANLILKFEMVNIGHTPAIGTFTYPKFFPLSSAQQESESQEKQTCESAIRITRFSDETLFPNTTPTSKEVKFFWSPEELAKHSAHGFLSIQIVTCTAYRSSYSNTIYSSPQIYKFDRLGPNGESLALEAGKTVPAANLHLGIGLERVVVAESNYKMH